MPRTIWAPAARRTPSSPRSARPIPCRCTASACRSVQPRPLDREHLLRLRDLVRRYEPFLFSEHLAWSSHGEVFLNDLLPLPYTQATLDRIVDHVDEVQAVLGRRMLLENPATYVTFEESTIGEIDFLAAIARRTGCGLLLDVNNVFVSATNHATSAEAYVDAFPLDHVGEIHLAGHAASEDETGAPLLIDAHDRPVADPVWALYERVVARAGGRPTLIEWDNDVPDWPVLAAEARLRRRRHGAAGAPARGVRPRAMISRTPRQPSPSRCSTRTPRLRTG